MRAMALLMALLPAASASAWEAVLLPRTGGSGASVLAHQRAEEALARALENDGWVVHRLDDASSSLPARLAACGPDDRCGWDLARRLGLDTALGLRVWGDGERVDRVAVLVVAGRGVGHGAVVTVDAGRPVEHAVAEAARGAIRAWTSAGGFRPPAAPDPAPEALRDGRLEPSPLNAFLGGFLALGSAPLLGYGINTLVREGECVNSTSAGCIERVRFGEGAAIFMGAGALVAVAAVFVWVVQPVRLRVRAAAQAATLSLEHSF